MNSNDFVVDNLIKTINNTYKYASDNSNAISVNSKIIKQSRIRELKYEISKTKNLAKKRQLQVELNALILGEKSDEIF